MELILQEANKHFLDGNFDIAAKMYLELAREGSVVASFNYGYCLWLGLGVDYNPKEAKSFFAFARDLKGGESAYNIAMLYMRGEGVTKNYKKAIEYMKLASDLDCVEAMLYLGMVYTTGCILEPDIIRISRIPFHTPEYRLGSEFLLAGDYKDAIEDEELRYSVLDADGKVAFEYFRRAAYADPTYVGELVAKGQFLYAKCYIDGLGTDFDRKKGARLMLTAGRNGSSDAVAFLAENGITPDKYLSDKNKGRTGGV